MVEKTAVVLTALNLEYRAVRRRLVDPQLQCHERGTLFEVGTLPGSDFRVALALAQKGNHAAAVMAERSIQAFEPAAVLFVGVAGALWDATALGDVVVATHVYAYHGGTSEDDGFKARPRVWEAEHSISQLAAHVARLEDWSGSEAGYGEPPLVHFGPIAAGEVVHNSRSSHEANLVRQHYNDALAIEMEAAGVAQAAHLNGAPVAVVRGISDKADGSKTSTADGSWQPCAADNAAAFATCLVRELLDGKEGNRTMHQRSDPGSGNIVNIADGNSTVSFQAGSVTNSVVTIGTAPDDSTMPDLAAELVGVREELDRARSTGAVDEPTYEAAQSELELADKALEVNWSEGRNRFLIALKRLSGLISGAVGAASKVAGIIAAVDALS